MKDRGRTFICDTIALGVLVAASAKLVFGLHGFMDIDFLDETYYLTRGVGLLSSGPPPPENSPLYAVWYFLLHLLQADPIKLHYLNYQILTLLIPLLLYILLRRLTVSAFTAMVTAAYFLLSFANLPSYPKSWHFASVVILAALVISTAFKSRRLAMLCLALGSLLGSYVRPELSSAYLLFSIVYLADLVLHARTIRPAHDLPAVTLFVAAPLCLIAIFGSPILMGEDRSFLAFRHFFTLNLAEWSGAEVDPWNDYGRVVSQQFGAAGSVLEAVVRSPALFFKHVAYNSARIPISFGKSLFLHYNLILPVDSRGLWIAEAGLLLAGGLGYIAFAFVRTFSQIKSRVREQKRALFQLAVICLPGLLASAIFLPKRYYLIAAVIFVLVFLAVSCLRDVGRAWGIRKMALAGAIVVVLTPCLCRFGNDGQLTLTGRMANVRTARFIRSLGITEDVVLLTAEGRHHVYCGERFSSVRASEKDCEFLRFMRQHGVNMILRTQRLDGNSSFEEDSGWRSFCNDFRAFGFEEIAVSDTGRKLLVKTELLASRRNE